MAFVKLWVRAECKPNEFRAPLTPTGCEQLLSKGHKVIVEKSKQRVFKDDEYKSVGCELVEGGSWKNSPKDAIIVGIKELEEDVASLANTHVYFGHVYKNQTGWKDLLRRFDVGGGTLLDAEFMVDSQGTRVVADEFSRMAGRSGAVVGLDAWCMQKLWPNKMFPKVEPYNSESEFIVALQGKMNEVSKQVGKTTFPKIIVVGAHGRCGQGSVDILNKCGIPSEYITKWGSAETKRGGPFTEILDHDIFINDIFLSKKIPPFITMEMLDVPQRRLSVVVDVSCDCSSADNPIPIYNSITTFEKPTHRLTFSPKSLYLDVIAIDHLPSLLPRESSERFSEKLVPCLASLPKMKEESVWINSLKIFKEKIEEATKKD